MTFHGASKSEKPANLSSTLENPTRHVDQKFNYLSPNTSPSRKLPSPIPSASCQPHMTPKVHDSTSHVLGIPYHDVAEYYFLGEEIGRGVSGVIRQCVARRDGAVYACKSVRKRNVTRDDVSRFIRGEIRALQLASGHSGVGRLVDTMEDERDVHLILELCEGGDLFDRIIKKGRFTEHDAAHALKKLLSVVHYCHMHNLMHRDLKPENILLVSLHSDTDVKVVDFGQATFFTPGTKLSEIVGTPYYVAPEVLRGSYGPEADTWSLGVILYVLLCGDPPFRAESKNVILKKVRAGVFDISTGIWQQISAEAKDLVRRMLRYDFSERITPREALEHPWITVNCAPESYLEQNLNQNPRFTVHHIKDAFSKSSHSQHQHESRRHYCTNSSPSQPHLRQSFSIEPSQSKPSSSQLCLSQSFPSEPSSSQSSPNQYSLSPSPNNHFHRKHKTSLFESLGHKSHEPSSNNIGSKTLSPSHNISTQIEHHSNEIVDSYCLPQQESTPIVIVCESDLVRSQFNSQMYQNSNDSNFVNQNPIFPIGDLLVAVAGRVKILEDDFPIFGTNGVRTLSLGMKGVHVKETYDGKECRVEITFTNPNHNTNHNANHNSNHPEERNLSLQM